MIFSNMSLETLKNHAQYHLNSYKKCMIRFLIISYVLVVLIIVFSILTVSWEVLMSYDTEREMGPQRYRVGRKITPDWHFFWPQMFGIICLARSIGYYLPTQIDRVSSSDPPSGWCFWQKINNYLEVGLP